MTRRLLLLQGPVGGFFGFLQNHLRSEGFEARRLVFNGGDIAYALGSPYEIVRFGTESHAAFFDRLLAEWRPDAIVLFGDERPVHRAARKCAEEAGIPVWCFEEGYIRPDHVTFEKGGNNANSSLRARFDPTVVPPTVAAAPRLFGQTVAMGLRAWGYFVAHRISRRLFPGYTHHRERRLRDEFRFWIRSAWRRAMSHRHDRALVAEIVAGLHPPFFIVALQVHDDMQLRVHGRGWKTMSFVEMVLESFRRAAPAEARLVIKAHPLDVGHGHNKKNIRLLIEKYGLAARVEFLQSGPLLPIVRHARGLVTINSTAGIAALRNHIPVIAFGEALYHLEGLSRRPDGVEDLDRFWIAPPEVDVVRAWRFGEHVMHEVLLPGSYYLPATWPALAARVTERLIRGLDPPVAPPIGEPTTALPVPPPGPAPSHRPRVGIASGGVWRRRESVARLLDAEPVRIGPWSTRGCDLLAGWGHKATTRRIRARAAAADLPYVAIEDGFLRSVRPGADEVAIGWIVDRSGVYYDTLRPNDFEAAVVRRAAAVEADHGEIRSALDAIRDLRLSKYNHA
ncbi:MAG: hypothetical protein OEL76_19155, partial [Siculibacillus sp.]|nr:hypothetical protein [Siculibacillus sp.]